MAWAPVLSGSSRRNGDGSPWCPRTEDITPPTSRVTLRWFRATPHCPLYLKFCGCGHVPLGERGESIRGSPKGTWEIDTAPDGVLLHWQRHDCIYAGRPAPMVFWHLYWSILPCWPNEKFTKDGDHYVSILPLLVWNASISLHPPDEKGGNCILGAPVTAGEFPRLRRGVVHGVPPESLPYPAWHDTGYPYRTPNTPTPNLENICYIIIFIHSFFVI